MIAAVPGRLRRGRMLCDSSDLGESSNSDVAASLPPFHRVSEGIPMIIVDGYDATVSGLLAEEEVGACNFLLNTWALDEGLVGFVKFKNHCQRFPLRAHAVVPRKPTQPVGKENVSDTNTQVQYSVSLETFRFLDDLLTSFFPVVRNFVSVAVSMPHYMDIWTLPTTGEQIGEDVQAQILATIGSHGFAIQPATEGFSIFYIRPAKRGLLRWKKAPTPLTVSTSVTFDFCRGLLLHKKATNRRKGLLSSFLKKKTPFRIISEDATGFFQTFLLSPVSLKKDSSSRDGGQEDGPRVRYKSEKYVVQADALDSNCTVESVAPPSCDADLAQLLKIKSVGFSVSATVIRWMTKAVSNEEASETFFDTLRPLVPELFEKMVSECYANAKTIFGSRFDHHPGEKDGVPGHKSSTEGSDTAIFEEKEPHPNGTTTALATSEAPPRLVVIPEMCKDQVGMLPQGPLQPPVGAESRMEVIQKPPGLPLARKSVSSVYEEKSKDLEGNSAVPTLKLALLSRRRDSTDSNTASERAHLLPMTDVSYRPGTYSTRSSRRQFLLSQQTISTRHSSQGMPTPTAGTLTPGQPSPASPAALAATSRSSLGGSTGIESPSPENVMPALRLPLFRVDHTIVESVRAPFTPSRRFITSRRHSNDVFGDPFTRLRDISIKAGESCVAKDLWALVTRRRDAHKEFPTRISCERPQASIDKEERQGIAADNPFHAIVGLLRCLSALLQVEQTRFNARILNSADKENLCRLCFFLSISVSKDRALRQVPELFDAMTPYLVGSSINAAYFVARFEAIQHRVVLTLKEQNPSQPASSLVKARRALKSLGFEHVVTLSVLSQYLKAYRSSQPVDSVVLSDNMKGHLTYFRDSVNQVYMRLSACMEDTTTSPKFGPGASAEMGDRWILGLLSHPHANSLSALLSVLEHYFEGSIDTNESVWVVETFVMDENFVWCVTFYVDQLLQFSFPNEWLTGEHLPGPAKLYLEYLHLALAFLDNTAKLIRLRSNQLEKFGKISSFCEIYSRQFEPSFRVVLDWMERVQRIPGDAVCKPKFLEIRNRLLKLEASVVSLPKNECMLLRSYTAAYIPFHFMSFMKLYSSTDFSEANIDLCKQHLRIILQLVIASAQATIRRSPQHSQAGLKAGTKSDASYCENLIDEDHVMVWSELSSVLFHTRLIPFFLHEFFIESELKITCKSGQQEQDGDTKHGLLPPALNLPLPLKTEEESGNVPTPGSSMEHLTPKSSRDPLEESFGSSYYDSEYGDLMPENNFSFTPSPEKKKPLLSLSLPATEKKGGIGEPSLTPMMDSLLTGSPITTAANALPMLSFGGLNNSASLVGDATSLVCEDSSAAFEEAILAKKKSMKLYYDDELHELLLILTIRLAVDAEGGSLDPRYSPRIPLFEDGKKQGNVAESSGEENLGSQLNLPFVLHAHLNDSSNAKLVDSLLERASSLPLGPGPFRFLKLLCTTLFEQSTDTKFGEPLNLSSSLIGSGAFGSVHGNTFLTNTNVMVPAAVKIVPLPKSRFNRSSIVDVFAEVSALEVLADSNHAVELLEYGVSSRCLGYCIVMKRCTMDLKSWRQQEKVMALSKPSLLSKCLEYFEKVVLAVNFIHTKGVTHYDVKCDNVLVTEEGDVRLVDFGEASVRPGWDAQNVYNTRDRGTECIKSPEMLTVCHAEDGDRPQYDRRRKAGTNATSDVWSLGCLLYELLMGEFLFQDEDWTRFYCRLTGRGQQLIPDNARAGLLQFGSGGRDILELLQASMLVRDPGRRMSANDLLRWLRKYRGGAKID